MSTDLQRALEEASFGNVIERFIEQAHSGNLKTKNLYPQEVGNLRVEVSFGQGAPAEIPWIAFPGGNQKVQSGIYPVFLYYKSNDCLILAYGISETEAPLITWGAASKGCPSIAEYFKRTGKAAKRYGNSLVAAAYENASTSCTSPSFKSQVIADLANLLHDYQRIALSNAAEKIATSVPSYTAGQAKNAWLLTWNPSQFNLGGDGSSDYRLDLSIGSEQRWSCVSRQPQVGDIVYLIRLGIEPRGIIAQGIITQSPYQDEDWKDPSKSRWYIKFKVSEHRPECASGLLPITLLEKAFPQQQWSSQASGIAISKDVQAPLAELWENGKESHSLRQYIEWSRKDPIESRPDWLQRYQAITGLTERLRNGEASLDTEALKRLWMDKDNGVTGLGPGMLAQRLMDTHSGLLLEITKNAIAHPDAETFSSALSSWREAVDSRSLERMQPAAIKRAYAAIAPDRFTTLLNESDCRYLLGELSSRFQLPASIKGDWPELNTAIKDCLTKAGVSNATALENNIALWQLLMALQGKDPYGNQVESTEEQPSKNSAGDVHVNIPLNQILYGPPGTGKTHNTINEALRILEPELLTTPGVSREDLVAAFNRYVKNEQIVFCTFHQSFSYEDFVEGLRAHSLEGRLIYEVKPGIFTELCRRAEKGVTASEDPFDQALAKLQQKFDENEGRLDLKTVKGKPFTAEYSGGQTFLVYPGEASGQRAYHYASLDLVHKLYMTGNKEGIYNLPYVRAMLNFLIKQCGLPEVAPQPTPTSAQQKFVLIIDEINRGNISRIFGELITLIEPAKRAGQPEALEVKLPYSRETLSVPANLYLIGTMNTADRSLAGLDIALRRRFTFKEMPPRADLLEYLLPELPVDEILEVMNQRIELLLDRDHCLGHAYFLPLMADPTLQRLRQIFREQIIPLLQEYFFEDWERIQWVLNDHRKKPPFRFLLKPAGDAQQLFGEDITIDRGTTRWLINDEAFGRIESFLGIIDHQAEIGSPKIVQEANHGPYVVRLLADGSYQILENDIPLSKAKPAMRLIAGELSLAVKNENGIDLTTRQLGRRLLNALGAKA